MKLFLLRRRARTLWQKPRFRQTGAVVALVLLVAVSLLIQHLSKEQVFTDATAKLSVASKIGEALVLGTTTNGQDDLLTFAGVGGRVVLFDSPAAELSAVARGNLKKIGAPTPPEGITEILHGPHLDPGDRASGSAEPGCLPTLRLRSAENLPLLLRLAAEVDPGQRRVLAIEILQGALVVDFSTGLPTGDSTDAPGCKMELVLGSYRLVEEAPARQEFLVPAGSDLTLTFDILAGAPPWGNEGFLEPFQPRLPVALNRLDILGEADRLLLRARARETTGLRLTRLALGAGELEAEMVGDFIAAGPRRPEGGRSRISFRLGPVVDRLWQMALASLYLAVFVGLKKAFFPRRSG